jgi:hypothetical protein
VEVHSRGWRQIHGRRERNLPLRKLASLPWYPVALAGVIVFSAYLDSDVSAHAAVRPFLVVVAAAAVLTAAAARLLGWTRGPILVAALSLIVRSGDPLHAGIATLLVLLAGFTWLMARRILPGTAAIRDPNRLLNSVTLVLLGSTLLTAAVTGTLGRIDLGQGRPFATAATASGTDRPESPDIYLILLDGYPRADTLERVFSFDNSDFAAQLQDRRFVIADSSRSNYMYTGMSLSSVFHMQYVQQIPGAAGARTPYGASLRTLINHNPVWDALRSRGYLIAANQAPWESVGMRDADLFCGDEVNDFELYLLRVSLVGHLVDAVYPPFEADQHRAMINQAFDCLGQLSFPTSSPKLVFTHVGGPHLPVVFTESGAAADRDVFGYTKQELKVSGERFAAAYAEEIQYLNRRTLEAVDRLLARPDAPIVIVMSDHGSESRLNWTDASRSDLQERFSNFFASRTPARPAIFGADVTPINIFPVLFDAYFGENLPLIEDRFFVSPANQTLKFTEITDPAPPAS